MVKSRAMINGVVDSLLDPKNDVNDVRMQLATICMGESPDSNRVVEQLRIRANKDKALKDLVQKKRELSELAQSLQDGPLRAATYVAKCAHPDKPLRSEVLLQNGDIAYPTVLDSALCDELTCGDTVLLDVQARALVQRAASEMATGEIADLERRVDESRIEISLGDHHHELYSVSAALRKQLDDGQVEPGARLRVCTRTRMAFESLPEDDGFSRYHFLEQGPIPNVDAARDIGCPPAYIEEIIQHVRSEMQHPEVGRLYGVRPMQTRLLTGVTGTGKTLSILATIHGVYDQMSQITGAPVSALPPRVLRLRSAQYLSKWLGESDKRLDRFFDEAVQLAKEKFVWKGRQWSLPVICRCEEIDGLARARGTSDEVYGRIQTTVLERLDHLSDELGNLLVIFLFTTNTPEVCDTAFLRRAGGEIVNFGRIGRAQFHAILSKRIHGLPLAPQLGGDSQLAERRLCRDVTNWIYSPNGHDPGQVEITLAGSNTSMVHYRRDLLTGAIIDLSVLQACKEARQQHLAGRPTSGVHRNMLLTAFDRQIGNICEQITEHNAPQYLTLPNGARVAGVRRIEQPTIQPFELESDS
jgi:ATP-dependent 26S proteasome regulatory subunit